MNTLSNKIYCVVSKWSYPFGGGEEFLYQTMEWAHKLGMKCYWISFTTAANKPYKQLEIESFEYGKLIRIPDGLTSLSLYNWLKIIKPDIVHHQGHERVLFYEVCELLRIEFLSGFHFWSGGVILDPSVFNTKILENYNKHRVDPQLTYLINKKYCNLYTVTPFVTECIKKITGLEINDNIFAASSYEKCKIYNINPINNKYVSIINIHKNKGGELLLDLINELNIPFLGVKTEFMSEDLDNKLDEAAKKSGISKIIERVKDPKDIFIQTKIFLAPSIVDETFCRTVNEAMLNGIPILTTGYGNLQYLIDNPKYIIPIEDKQRWKSMIMELYTDQESYKEASEFCLKKYEDFSEQKAIKQFESVMAKTIGKSKEMNVMIFTPWCDQGLGIQSRNYYNILVKNGFNVSIFSVKPYIANSSIELQKDPNEWIVDNIYYSQNDREHVKDIEIIEFIKQYNIGKCLLPETCWFRVFEIAKLLKSNNVKCYAIPNIEIVRSDEIFKHKYFYKILANNYLCLNIFKKYNINNVEYIGYGIKNELMKPITKTFSGKIKYLMIGGMNAFSRKHVLEVCEAFNLAYQKNDNIMLTCTIQKTNLLELNDKIKIETYFNHPAITVIQDHLPHNKIIELYNENHVIIQVSKHEGLGLGFYEALATSTPVITLNTAPHNEIIKNNINGWVIDCYYKRMTDNNFGLFDSAYFEPEKLADIIAKINIKDIQDMIKTLNEDNKNRNNYEIFEKKFINTL